MNFKKMKQMKQEGVTLVELVLGISVILIVIGIGILVFANVQSGARAYKVESQIMTLMGEIRKVNPSPDFNGLTEAVIINAGKAPSDMINGATLRNVWGGAVTIAASDLAGGTDNAFDISYALVPRSVCNDIIAASVPLFAEILVGGSAVKDASTPQPTGAQVSTACNNDTNLVVFRGTS